MHHKSGRSHDRSDTVDPATVAKSCFTTLPVRKSRLAGRFDELSITIHQEFADLGIIGAENSYKYFKEMGELTALACPEVLDDRVEILAYLFHLAALQDDLADSVDTTSANVVNGMWADGSVSSVIPQNVAEKIRAKKQIECRSVLAMIELDREQGRQVFEAWKDYYNNVSGSKVPQSVKSFKEWQEYRYEDCSVRQSVQLLCFGAGISLSQAEKDSVDDVIQPLMHNLVLVNDYYSFDKEWLEAAQHNNFSEVKNGVWTIMQLRGVTKEEAKKELERRIMETEDQYHRARCELENSFGGVANHVWRYIDVVAHLTAGNFYWSSISSRYHDITISANAPAFRDLGPSWEVKPSPLLEQQASHSLGTIPMPLPTGDKIEKRQLEAALHEHLKTSPGVWQEAMMAPYEYLRSLPSKGVRNKAIDALNVWYKVPQEKLAPIKSIITLLHSASLMLDDIEDRSPLRRGHPATHTVFGEAQTINSANYLFVMALDEAQELSAAAVRITVSELKSLHQGQSMDLYWTHTVTCPSTEEYLSMVDKKTGGLFRLLGRLMESESALQDNVQAEICVEAFMTLVGRYFQIRDDYQNLSSLDYTNQKGFCEDLDEGKFSLALIHLLEHTKDKLLLQALLLERKRQGKMQFEAKNMMLDRLGKQGSLEYVKKVAQDLEMNLDAEIKRIENVTSEKNWILRLIVEILKL